MNTLIHSWLSTSHWMEWQLFLVVPPGVEPDFSGWKPDVLTDRRWDQIWSGRNSTYRHGLLRLALINVTELHFIWLRGEDSNLRPPGYEPGELPLLLPRYVLRLEDSNLSGVYLPNRLMRTTLHQYRNIILVTPQGLEPRLAGPKPAVLPLDERVIWRSHRESNPALCRDRAIL